MRKFLTILFMTLLAYAVGYDVGWAEESVYKTLTFTSETQDNNQSYTGTYTATQDGFSCSIANFNNNNNGWNGQIKCGRKSNASVATITTTNAIDKAITKVNVTYHAITSRNVKSAKLEVATNAAFTQNLQTITFTPTANSVGTITVTTPTENCYYRLTYDMASGSNGSLALSKLEFYYDPDAGSGSHNLTDGSSNGSVTFTVDDSPVTEAAAGATVTATATPATGYEFDSWNEPSGVSGWNESGNTASFTMPAAAVSVSANFTAAEPSTGGTMEFVQTSSSAGTLSGAPSATPSVTASFSNTYINNKEQITKNNKMTLTISNMPSIYKITGIRLSVHNNKSGGSGTATITMNNTTFGTVGISNYSSNNGYVIIPVTLTSTPACNGNLVVQIDASESSVFCNHFYIDYEQISPKAYDVTLTQPAEGGSVSAKPSGEKVVDAGDAIVVTATPSYGYKLNEWDITGIRETNLSASTNTITVHATGDVNASATFSKINYSIRVTDVTGCTITAPSTANYGDEVTLSATLSTGYVLNAWDVRDASNNAITVTNNKFTMPASNVTVTANVSAPQAITRTISTNGTAGNTDGGWLGNWAVKSNTTGYVHADYQEGTSGATNYDVVAGVGTHVQFQAGTNNGYEIVPANISITSGGNPVSFTTVPATTGGGYIVTFTMPAAPVAISANFTTYISDLYILGTANENDWAGDVGVAMTKPASVSGNYSARVYFKGDNGYFSFATALGSDANTYPADANRFNPATNNYDLANNNYTAAISSDNASSNSLMLPAGIYDITVNAAKTQVTVAPVTITAPTLSVAAGDVYQNSSVSVTAGDLSDLLADIVSGKSATTELSTDGTTYTAGSSYTFATTGNVTVSARDSYGSIHSPVASAAYNVRKESTSNTYELVTNASQLEDNGKYIIVANDQTYGVYGLSKEDAKATNSDIRKAVQDVTINGNVATITTLTTPLTLESVDNYWKFNTGSGYLYLDGYGNYLKHGTPSTADNAKASITIGSSSENYAATIVFKDFPQRSETQTAVRYLQFNANPTSGIPVDPRFACYYSSQTKVQLYKQVKSGEFPISYATGTNGSVSGVSDADKGDEVTVTVTADEGYAASDAPTVTTSDSNNQSLPVTDNSDGTYSFTVPANLATGSTITVTPPRFAALIGITYVNKYYDSNGDLQTGTTGGTVSGSASAIEGANVNVTITPESDYQVQSVVYTWASGSRDITEGLSFLMPGTATTVTATFVKKPFNISVSSSDGEVSGMPATAVSGQEVTFTVTPNAGYVVSGVSGTFNNGNGTLNITDNGNRTYTFNMPASDVAITVTYFASEDYELLTDLADINYEDNYLIVAGADGTNYKKEGETVQVLSGVNSSNIGTNVAATLGERGILSSTAAMKTVTFSAGSTTGTYKMYIAGNGYVNTSASGKLNVSNDVNDAVDLTLVVTANADTIKMVGTNNVLRYNTGSPRFCFYNSATGQVIRIFKLANQNKVKRPSITGDAGQYLGIYNFIGKDSVSLACATEGATIEYSLDGGTTWTAYDAAHRPEITTNAAGNTVSVMARATKTGMEASDAVTATFTCVAPTWHTKPCGDNWACKDTIFNNPVFIYPICSLANRNAYGKANCQFFYTTNGTTPTLASTELPVPSSGEKFLFLDQDVELTMIPVINGIAGEPVTGLIYFEPAAPVITLASGSYGGDQKTQLRTDTKTQHKGASWITKIYYFVETTSNTYEAFTFNAETGEPTAAAIAAGWQLYQPGTSPYVDILLANGEMQDLHAVTLTNFYAAPFDGTYSDASRTLNGTWTLSKESVASYTLTTAPLDVIFSPAGGNYLYAKDVVLTPVNSIGGATIYYTTDGTEPTTASAVYSAPIHVGPGSTTIKVYAVDNRMDATGGTFTKEYTYNIGVQEPLFSPFPGDYPGNGATKWGRQFKGVNEGDVTVEIFDVTPNAEIHYTYTETLTNSDHENFTYTEPADPTRSSTAYTEPIALKPGYTYIFKAIAYVGNQASPIRTRAFTVDQITSSEAAGYWMNVKAMNEETSTSTAKKFANPIEVIYMSTWRNSGNKPEYCFIRDNSGYGLVYFGGKDVTAYNGYTIFNPGDWLPGNSVGGKVSVWSESYINELGSSSGSITAWPTTAMANRAIIPETTTCQAIRDGWTYKVDGKPASISGDKAVYKQYVDPVNNKFGHYVHLRKNKITNVVRTGNNLTTENPGKLSGIITGELGTPLQYYDGFYLFSGYNGATAKTQDDFNAIQDKGGTFDVYAVVQFYGSNTTNGTYSYAPYEVFPIAFDHIFPPIFNLAGDGTAADMTIDNPERTRYEATTLTLSCETRGAVIMYKTSDMEDFAVYNGEIINVDKTMTIETYSLHSTEHFDQLESKVRKLTINMGSVEQPEISPESVMRAIGGKAVDASISCATEGATIWYTTDGSDPRDDTNAGRYEYNAGGSNPALTGISSTTTVRAIAEADGFYSVEAEPKTYTFVKSNGIVYDLVTSEADLKEGAIYVIVSKEYNMAMQRSQKENNRDQSPVLFLQEGDEGYVAEKTKVYGNDDLAVFTLHKFAGTGPNWTLHTSNGVNNASIGYLYGQASGSTNQLKTEFTLDSEGKTEAYIEIDSDGMAHISFVKPDEPRYLRYNHSFNLFNSYTNESTGDPVYLYKKDAFPLANIEKKGVKDQQYTVADELIGVYAKGNKLWAKDQAVSIDANDKPEGYSDFLLEEAFIGEAKNELSGKNINVPNRYLQNNWVVLIMPEGTDAADYVDAYIPAASVIGELTDDVNYTITLKQAPGAPINMSTDELYVKNVYAPTSFVNTYWGENDSEIYFVKPKVQEVANIAWAVWDGSKFNMPETCPAGSFAISDFTLNSDLAPTLETGKAYAFMAVMENGGSSLSGIRRLKSGDSPATFNIKPLNLTSSSPVTGISNVGGSVKEVKSVRVYNVAGVEQRELQPGVNIVVTTYTDGTRSTAKVLR